MDSHPDTTGQNSGSSLERQVLPPLAASLRKGSGSGRNVKVRLLSRDQLDNRSSAAKEFDRLAAEIQTDLGRRAQLSAIELALIEAFCGSAILLNALNTKILLGQEIELSEYAAVVSSMVRVGSRLGLHRRQCDVTPSLGDYLRPPQPADADDE
jgi:hypothetical protein